MNATQTAETPVQSAFSFVSRLLWTSNRLYQCKFRAVSKLLKRMVKQERTKTVCHRV